MGDDHRSLADDRVQPDPEGSEARHQRRDVLAVDGRHRGDVAVRLLWRSHIIDPTVGFVLGMSGWGYILNEIFNGEAGKVNAAGGAVNKHVQASFGTMRCIVTIGWSIYPLGYFFGYLLGGVAPSALNL